jgi:hypothetical protein
MRIEVTLPKWPKRETPGTIRLICPDRGVVVEARCLGKADNEAAKSNGNPSRNPIHRFGDLPAGEYIAWIEHKPHIPERTYGKYRPLRLIPKSGDALLAAKNGRTGLLQHGGYLNQRGELRPTNGCNRVDDATQEAVLSEMEKAGLNQIPYSVKEA